MDTDEDPKGCLRNVLNLSFLLSGTKKACNIEPEIKPRNLSGWPRRTLSKVEKISHSNKMK